MQSPAPVSTTVPDCPLLSSALASLLEAAPPYCPTLPAGSGQMPRVTSDTPLTRAPTGGSALDAEYGGKDRAALIAENRRLRKEIERITGTSWSAAKGEPRQTKTPREKSLAANPASDSLSAPPPDMTCPVLSEYLSLLPLCHNAVGEGSADPALAGSEVRAGGKEFTFDLGPQDALLVIDMQNDFVPKGPFNSRGGRFAVAEGDLIGDEIADLMQHFSKAGATVFATRDYHPYDHCSFAGHGGHFPAHCVQGHVGSYFYRPVSNTLQKLCSSNDAKDRTKIVFKAFHECVDSFGGLTYPKDHADARDRWEGMNALPSSGEPKLFHGCQKEVFTGCRVFKCSNWPFSVQDGGEFDVNAPPDVMAERHGALGGEYGGPLEAYMHEKGLKRLFVCGLAFDFCVLDTCCNGKRLGFDEVYLVADAARPAYIPGFGTYGSGFLQAPQSVKQKLVDFGAKFCFVADILPEQPPPPIPVPGQPTTGCYGGSFPISLGPWVLDTAPSFFEHMKVREKPTANKGGIFKMAFSRQGGGGMEALKTLGVSNNGNFGPLMRLDLPDAVRQELDINDDVCHYCYVHPLDGADVLATDGRFAWCLRNPDFTLPLLGGYAYFDTKNEVVAMLAITTVGGDGGGAKHAVRFDAPQPCGGLPKEICDRMQPAPRGTMLAKNGAQRMCALGNGELGCVYGGLAIEKGPGDILIFAHSGSGGVEG